MPHTTATVRPDCMIDDDAILGAGHALYALAYEHACEERGIQNTPGGCRIDDWVARADPDIIRPIVWRYLGRVEQAWGYPVGLVLHHMGLESSDDQESAIYRLLMGCQGHGISLEDEHSEQLERASEILNRFCDPPVYFDARPFDSEMNEFSELAEIQVDIDFPDSVRNDD